MASRRKDPPPPAEPTRAELLIGLRRDLLEAQALASEQGRPRELALVSKELRAVAAELEQIAPAKASTVDALAARRDARRSAAANRAPAGGRA
jgi:hypothetical protein